VIRVVDLSGWWDGSPDARRAIAEHMDAAGQSLGFAQIVGHRVSPAVIDAMRNATAEFFALPFTDKLAVRPPSADVNRGYAARGTESLTYSLGVERPPDLFEAFNIGPDSVDEADPAIAAERHRIFAPNLWPTQVPALRRALTDYFDEVADLARTLTDVFAAALGMPEGWFRQFTTHSTDTVRVNHYERHAGDRPPSEQQMRMGAHTDYGIVTVLYADPVPGLQVLQHDGVWLDVQPDPGAFLINLGDLTAQWTNDRWRSTLHRVVPPPGDATGAALRRSVAFFHDGNYDALIECLPTCCSPENPARYAPVTAGEHLMAKLLGPRTLTASSAADTVSDRRAGLDR
jgi:isopenicillin N synthase-like dioxygenase